MHNFDVVEKSGGKLTRVNVLFKDCKNLVEQLLLVQIVNLQGGVHLVDDGVLVNKPRELAHDWGDQVAIVSEADMDVVARNNLMLPVHAHVKLSIDTVYFDILHRVWDASTVRDSSSMTWVDFMLDSPFLISLDSNGLNEGNIRE